MNEMNENLGKKKSMLGKKIVVVAFMSFWAACAQRLLEDEPLFIITILAYTSVFFALSMPIAALIPGISGIFFAFVWIVFLSSLAGGNAIENRRSRDELREMLSRPLGEVDTR